jgi:L-fucono-1,5-lactonase
VFAASGGYPRSVRLDAHQHFWRYSRAEYGWIDERMSRIARDFLPANLAPALAAAGFDGCIAVQARASIAENESLLALAREHPFVRGIVGWVDLCAEDVARDLERLAREPRFKGVRHAVQDEPDDRFLLRPDFQRGVERLAGSGLAFDLLVHPRHLEVARRFVERHPGQTFVLDHLAKPAIARGERAPWERQFRALGGFPHVSCKVSGLVTEARWNDWKPEDFRFYLDVALETFGQERLLFGSDWPVCLLAASDYRTVVELVEGWAEELPREARAALFGDNAARIYGVA